MRIPLAWHLVPFVALLLAVPTFAQAPEIKEHRFPNGFQILLQERPGAGSFHARLVLRSGRADTGSLPAAAAELLARTLFGRMLPEDLGAKGEFEALVREEAGLFESLRLERNRRARQGGADASPEEASLERLHAKRFEALSARCQAVAALDPLVAMGATRPEIFCGADELSFSFDLPSQGFATWCRLEQHRLQALNLFRFSLERQRMIQERGKAGPGGEDALGILLGTALSGHPYAQTFDFKKGRLEALTWSDVRALGRSLVSPERMTLILVGDLRLTSILPEVEATFGALRPSPEVHRGRVDGEMELAEPPGFCRLQASTSGDARVLVAWRIPSANHPDHGALQILAQVLGSPGNGRLVRRLQEARGLARSLTVRLDVPGGRDPSLFLIEARPGNGHSLAELEEAIHGEVLRIQRELLPEEDLRRAQRGLEAESMMAQEDAASLARLMGRCLAQSGDWQQAFRGGSPNREVSPDAIQAIIRRYLIPGQEIHALLEADPLLTPQDPLEEKLGKVLLTLLQQKLEDPGQVETIVRETLRQLRMLSPAEREQALKLLEAQTAS